MKQYIMALDQGTTSSRCILFNKQGDVCSMAQKEFEQIYPSPGWVEHNPREIWACQLGVALEAMSKIGVNASNIASIGITNQRETTIVWDKQTGEPIYNAIVWQCRRTADTINQLKKSKFGYEITKKTGLLLDAYFSASKISWILDHVTGARERAKAGELAFGTVDTWLIWNLTEGRVFTTDYTNASRTMLFNIHTLCWDSEILDYFDIPIEMLAQVKPSKYIYGETSASVIGGNIPIGGVAGDQQAALFGQCCHELGSVKNTYGTGCFLLMNTGNKPVYSKNGLITTIGIGLEEGKVEYALEGSIFVAGAAVQWLRDSLEMIPSSGVSEEYACKVTDTQGAYVVPAFTGLGAPYWDPYARGVVVGITRGFSKAHFIRAVLESIAYQTNDILKAMEMDAGTPIKTLRVDGGASGNDFLMQFQADILNTQVLRPRCIETTALGTAYLAGLAVGYWKDRQEIQSIGQIDRIFQSDMDDLRRAALLKGWKKALKCAFEWEKD